MSVLDREAVKASLKIRTDQSDDDLDAILEAAQAAIEQRTGPLEPTEVTQLLTDTCGASTLVLQVTPVISLTSVTPAGGTAFELSTLHVDADSGVVRLLSGGTFGASSNTVIYQAGRETCPADLRLAVSELVRHMWRAFRGSGQVGGATSTEVANTVPGSEQALPTRVEQLLIPHQLPGFS